MRQYGFAWPERMKCDDLPEYGDKDQLCMDFNTTDRPTAPPRFVQYNLAHILIYNSVHELLQFCMKTFFRSY